MLFDETLLLCDCQYWVINPNSPDYNWNIFYTGVSCEIWLLDNYVEDHSVPIEWDDIDSMLYIL